MFKFGSPVKVTNATVKVELPISRPVMGTCVTRTTSGWGDFFKELATDVKDESMKHEYERCRAAIKWAATCNGSVYSVNNSYGIGYDGMHIAIVFSFESYDDSTHFVKHLHTNVC